MKKTLFGLSSLVLSLGITGCFIYGIAGKEVIRQKISAGALVVDVRTPEEFARGHYKGSINIPLKELPQRLNEFGPKNAPLVVYCRTGNRSGKAKSILLQNGFSDVTNGGGFRNMQEL